MTGFSAFLQIIQNLLLHDDLGGFKGWEEVVGFAGQAHFKLFLAETLCPILFKKNFFDPQSRGVFAQIILDTFYDNSTNAIA